MVGGFRCDAVGSGELRIGFPQVALGELGQSCDGILEAARSGGFRTVSVWSSTPDGPEGLGPRLVARGFEYGWQAHWMGLRLDRQFPARRVEVSFSMVWGPPDGGVDGLPYGNHEESRILAAASRAAPDHVWCVGVVEGDRVVGRAVGFKSPNGPEFVGVYSMGVVPSHRRRGIGSMLLSALAARARERGSVGLVLNSAADGFYDRFGFESLGRGQTWWLHRGRPGFEPLSAAERDLVEAVGDGDLQRLARWDGGPAQLFHVKLPGHLTLAGLALRCGRASVFDWLEERGAPVSLGEAWERGGRERAERVLARDPESLSRRSGAHGAPPLHRAVESGDLGLARWLVARGADLGAVDTQFGGTAARWAFHLGRSDWIPLLEGRLPSE